MEFDTIEEARRVYNEYAYKLGFSISVASQRTSHVTKEVIRKEFECSHARKPNEEGGVSTSSSTQTAPQLAHDLETQRASKKKSASPAHMAAGLRDGKWKVIVMQPEYTHPLVKKLVRRKLLRSHRSISWADYELLKTLHHRNISTTQIMGILADFHGGVGNLTFSTTDVSNMRTHLRDFAKEFDYCVNHTETIDEFEMLRQKLEDKYSLQENEFFQSISSTRKMWAPAYFRTYFFPFTDTTGRSEFLTQYEYIMDTRAERENVESCKWEISYPPLWASYDFEKQAANFYTRNVFSKFQELLHDSRKFRMVDIAEDDESLSIRIVHPNSSRVRIVSVSNDATSYLCSCNMFARDGLLCPHILKVFTNRDVQEIPDKYLHRRWKMTGLAAEACSGPEKYTVASSGIDHLDKVDRKKSIMLQATEKAMKLKGTTKKKAKVPPCSYCHEEGHGVQTCKYMVYSRSNTQGA
ncbi:hypothetical protein GQ55_6G153400 [Panicum hallii var. hallii]|uniref:Protein FAR1-RELATED SEQUENCE n=1 Tax=Panicum hallii var. hallii TaxID=1504633 RepID=A0A2T7D6D5_9POAL|nr:hypothetical protein GQ55_6G153400 [Panicum hallii var. hallii]